MPADPTRVSTLRPLRRLLTELDDDLARRYAERGIVGVRPRYSVTLIRLHHLGPMTIRQLAEQVEVTHSAMSQTIAAMRRHGLVRTRLGVDARTRQVMLTDRGRALIPILQAEWRATEAALAELDAELPYPLTRLIADLAAALARRPSHDRVADHLAPPEHQQ